MLRWRIGSVAPFRLARKEMGNSSRAHVAANIRGCPVGKGAGSRGRIEK